MARDNLDVPLLEHAGVNLTPGQYVTQAYADSAAEAARVTGANLVAGKTYRRAFLVATESLDDDALFIDEPPKSTAIGSRIFRLAVKIDARHIHDELL